jgi:hypothetical protein
LINRLGLCHAEGRVFDHAPLTSPAKIARPDGGDTLVMMANGNHAIFTPRTGRSGSGSASSVCARRA